MLSPFEAFQQVKHHPLIKPLLDGGSIVSAGARAIVEGGYQSLPKCEMPGAMLIGDSAGLLNVPKIKGTHQAIRSGMLAAEHIVATNTAAGWDAKLRASPIMDELRKVRNIRPGFNKGFWMGLANAGLETVTAGHTPWTLDNHADATALKKVETYTAPTRDYVERTLPPRDRFAEVYFAATEHDEDQPVHLHVLDPSICVDAVRAGIQESLHAVLPGRRLRDRRRRHRQAAADQRRQLRALQDVRHQGSVRDHQLGDAGRRQRAELPESLSASFQRNLLKKTASLKPAVFISANPFASVAIDQSQ